MPRILPFQPIGGKSMIKQEEAMEAVQDTTPRGIPEHGQGIRSYKRDFPPAHYIWRIKYSKADIDKFESGTFETGGYKWSLEFHPNGDGDMDEKKYVSMYLVIEDKENLPSCWEVNVSFKFFVYMHVEAKYLTLEDDDGVIKRFHAGKTKWGFTQLLDLESFKNSSNWYRYNNMCTLGAEVFVLPRWSKQDAIVMVKPPHDNIITWTTKKFSMLDEKNDYSRVVTIEDYKWKLAVSLNGPRSNKNVNLSVYLYFDESEKVADDSRWWIEAKIWVRNQNDGSRVEQTTMKRWLPPTKAWGYNEFMSLVNLSDPKNGVLVDDCVIVEAQIVMFSKCKIIT